MMLLLVCTGHSMLSLYFLFFCLFHGPKNYLLFLDQSEVTLKRASWFSAARLNNGVSHWKCLVTYVVFLTDDSAFFLTPN